MKKFKTITKVTSTMILALIIMASMIGCSSRSKTEDYNAEGARDRSSEAYIEDSNTPMETYAAIDEYDYDYNYEACDAEYEEAYFGEDYVDTSYSDTSDSYTDYSETEQMLIRNVYMNVETSDFEGVTNSIKSSISTLGGYIESSSVSGTGNEGDLRYGSYTIRIPYNQMDTLLDTVGNNCIIVSESENTEDVTLQYSDIESRLEALRVEQNTVMGFLEEADSMDTILTLQQRLTELSYEIQSYESSARILSNLSTYSTLSLNISEVLIEVEPEKPVIPEPTEVPTMMEEMKEEISSSWKNVKKDLRSMAVDFVSELPYILATLVVFLVVAIPVVIVIVIVVKITKKKIAKNKIKNSTPDNNKVEEKTENNSES